MNDDPTNLMQAQLGLPNYGSVANPLGVPTIQAPPPPPVMHPGEVSVNLVQQAQQQTFQTLQSVQMTRPGGMGGYGTPGTGGGYGAYSTNGPMGALGGFGQQFQANMGSINQQQFGNPYYAQAISGMMGMPGFNQGMMPSPSMMTPPGMGIFRPFPQASPPFIPPVPQLPLIPHPFTPQLPAPRFQSPMEYQYNVGNQRGQQYLSAFMGTPGTLAHGAADVGGSYLGAALGATAGGYLGGARGVGIGSAVGALAGLGMAEFGGLGATAGHIADRMNPFRSIGIRGAQMKGMSQGFVVGGTSLHESGRGMSTQGSQHLGRLIEDLAYDPSFRKEMGGPSQFSAQDMTRIAKMSADQGMLDMAQNPEQIRDQVKNVAKGLRSFMRLASEPDIQEAVKQMGQMRAMGLSMPQIDATMQNVRMYAKMAGTTVKSILEGAGLQGAMVFQQQGMSAGLGLQMGAAAMGHARQAVAGGAYTPSQLALLGGTSGVAQRDMETSAAMLKMPVMLAAASQMGRGGTFGLDASSVRGLMGGHIGIDQMAGQGANNLLSAVNRGGVGALAMFQSQQSELSDQLGKTLGPEGMRMMKMNQVMQTQKMLGIEGPGGFITAAKAMGMDDQSARQMMLQANSPGYHRNIGQQINRQINELRTQEQDERTRSAPGAWDSMGQHSETLRDIKAGFSGLYRSFRGGVANATAFVGEMGEDAARRRQGFFSFRQPEELRATEQELRLSARDSRKGKEDFDAQVRAERARTSNTSAMFAIGGEGYGRSAFTKTGQDIMGGDADMLQQVRHAEGGWAGVFGGGILERFGRAAGGPLTWGNAAYSEDIHRRGVDIGKGSELVQRGLTASATDEASSQGKLAKTLGVPTGKAMALQTAVAMKIAKTAQESAGNWFNRLEGVAGGSAKESEIHRAIEEAGREQGYSVEQIQKLKDNAGDVMTGAAGLGKMVGGVQGRGWFRMPDIQDTKEHQDTVDAVRRVQVTQGNQLFGEKHTGEATFGSEERRTIAMRALFGRYRDPRVSALASLIQAASNGGDAEKRKLEEYMAELGEDGPRLRPQADEILKTAEAQGVSDLISKAGMRIQGKGVKEITEHFDTMGTGVRRSRTYMAHAEGMKKVFGTEGDLSTVLDKLSVDEGARAKLTEGGKEILKNWMSATDNETKEKILANANAQVDTEGMNEGDVRGGQRSLKEKMLQGIKSAMGPMAGTISDTFPEAVDTFQEASKAMLEAAKHLGSLGPGTTLHEETN